MVFIRKKQMNFDRRKYSHSSEVWLNWSEINLIQKKKKIIFFGRGEWLAKSLPYLSEPAFFIVDNNPYEHGQVEENLEIFSPEKLKEYDLNNIFILITTTSFPDVDLQLREYGLKGGENFAVSPSLKNFEITSRINSYDQQLLFTCSDQPKQGGGLYIYDLKKREKNLMIEGMCHGLARDGKTVVLVDDFVGIRIMDTNLETRKIYKMPPKSRPHGIAISEALNLFTVNFSGFDEIGIFDLRNGKSIGSIKISDKFEKTGVAQHHINDCAIYEDYLYVSMFSASGNWKIGAYDGVILQYDLKTKSLIGKVVENLWLPHTPTFINGQLHYCDSMRGIISNTTWKKLGEFSGFVRGLTYDGTFYFVGQSAHRYIDRASGMNKSISLDTGIFLFDPINNINKFFSIPDITDINSVLFLKK